MNAELSKKLKDAGFPWRKPSSGSYVPALSDLILACGKYFLTLRHTADNKWRASGHFPFKDSKIPYYESASYDESETAVAELYLALKLYERERKKE